MSTTMTLGKERVHRLFKKVMELADEKEVRQITDLMEA